MASEISPTAPERRIVLLGKAGAEKDRLVRVILGDTEFKEECEECSVYEGEHAGRMICIVDTPGWDSTSIEKTTKKIKNEITRSVTLCAPGPHALILVLPINTGDLPSANELKSACQHMELLSERVWNYTMVLFLCDGDVEESTMNDNIQNAEKLLQKCRDRHYVMNLETKTHGFLKAIDSMVEENIRNSKVKELGDFFLPQVYYDIMQSKMPHNEEPQKNTDKRQNEDKSVGTDVVGQRRGSLQGIKPNMNEQSGASDSHKDGTVGKNEDQLILMAFMGSLIGSVAGLQSGIMGAAVLIVFLLFLMRLSLWLVKLIT